MGEKLLRCPFCGSEASLYDIDDLYTHHAAALVQFRVMCTHCLATTEADDGYETKEEAIADWNIRATDSLPTYYILRRTVGGATMAYDYAYLDPSDQKFHWSIHKYDAFIFGTKSSAEHTKQVHELEAEIIPVKLMEAPYES
jgi:Lar family restriction alleviation protein